MCDVESIDIIYVMWAEASKSVKINENFEGLKMCLGVTGM